VRRLWFVVAIFLAASFFAACGNSSGLLNKHQLRTPLQCPCPIKAPLAAYQLPAEVPFGENAYIPGIVSGSDGNLWVTEYDADKIARVTLNGTITEFPLPTANAPGWIAAGPDGNLWINEDTVAVNTIGRMTTAGAVTEFPLPPPFHTERVANASDIGPVTAGPDGNIWFSLPAANSIGVMSTSGTLLTTYPVPTANSQPDFISTGPDGNMWFDEHAANKIGRLTIASGRIDEFPIPTPNSYPRNLVIGPDGNMWFPEAAVGKVARITPSGIITEFLMVADPTHHWLTRVAVSPDGSMWLVNAMLAPPWDSEIGTFNTAGVETNLWSYPTGLPRGLGVGPDGNPWFTDEANDAVVRL
jgi:virginiamycin B lyase